MDTGRWVASSVVAYVASSVPSIGYPCISRPGHFTDSLSSRILKKHSWLCAWETLDVTHHWVTGLVGTSYFYGLVCKVISSKVPKDLTL